MQNVSCMDGYQATFDSYGQMLDYHRNQSAGTIWKRSKVRELEVAALDRGSALAGKLGVFAPGTSQEAVDDTADNLGLALLVDHQYYPVRGTAYKSLLDRAKIGGSALPKLSRGDLAGVLNACLRLHKDAEALLLLRDEKVAAVHSGDEMDYSVLPVDRLLEKLQEKLDERFPGNVFEAGYCDHSLVSASWTMPGQKEELLETYQKTLKGQGQKTLAGRLVPGIRFITSDTGVASAKVSALLADGQWPIHIGSCISVDHRYKKSVEDFGNSLDQLFAQFGKSLEKLEKLLEIRLDYPVNAMTRICKKLSMPKKAAVEAIAMYEMANGGAAATAHDVFMAMQEIPYILKTQDTPQSKMLSVEENMARALSLRWSEFDLAKGVDY
ncbi:MAG: hypothetical protein NC548_65875 [Lachnospiraceae bacterium]|nr:hypothetical protein [Lachnospiraceae bacterium]